MVGLSARAGGSGAPMTRSRVRPSSFRGDSHSDANARAVCLLRRYVEQVAVATCRRRRARGRAAPVPSFWWVGIIMSDVFADSLVPFHPENAVAARHSRCVPFVGRMITRHRPCSL